MGAGKVNKKKLVWCVDMIGKGAVLIMLINAKHSE